MLGELKEGSNSRSIVNESSLSATNTGIITQKECDQLPISLSHSVKIPSIIAVVGSAVDVIVAFEVTLVVSAAAVDMDAVVVIRAVVLSVNVVSAVVDGIVVDADTTVVAAVSAIVVSAVVVIVVVIMVPG